MTAPIVNGESGSSVRTKLNATIVKADAAQTSLLEESVAILNSTGAATFYDIEGVLGSDIPNSASRLIVGNSVTSIGSYAFYGYTSITSVIMPNSVTQIDLGAFFSCTSLTSIIIPDSVTAIGDTAFFGCTSLTSIIIPDAVTSIGSSAFSGCTSLTSVIIPDAVTSIGSFGFNGCTSLTSVECSVTKTIIDAATNIFNNTNAALVITIPLTASTVVRDSWTEGTGLSIGGNTSVDVVFEV